jgi:hypothetical protein
LSQGRFGTVGSSGHPGATNRRLRVLDARLMGVSTTGLAECSEGCPGTDRGPAPLEIQLKKIKPAMPSGSSPRWALYQPMWWTIQVVYLCSGIEMLLLLLEQMRWQEDAVSRRQSHCGPMAGEVKIGYVRLDPLALTFWPAKGVASVSGPLRSLLRRQRKKAPPWGRGAG